MNETTLAPQQVLEWLQANPAFFDEFADELAEIYVPHAHRGQAISLAERQLLTLRDKNRTLEQRLGLMLRFGEENDTTTERLHALTVALLRAPDARTVLSETVNHLRDEFDLAGVAARVWDERFADVAVLTVGEQVQAVSANLQIPYCGQIVADEVRSWFGAQSDKLQSFAQLALFDGERAFGMVVLASEAPQHFSPDMGTLYLKRLGEVIAGALMRSIHAERVTG
ncbi:DUF484 family protein [Chitinibacteraceae bacterium HSL-7]